MSRAMQVPCHFVFCVWHGSCYSKNRANLPIQKFGSKILDVQKIESKELDQREGDYPYDCKSVNLCSFLDLTNTPTPLPGVGVGAMCVLCCQQPSRSLIAELARKFHKTHPQL